MFWRSPFAASDYPPGLLWWRGCREVLQEHWLTAFISHTVSKWKCGVPDYSLRTHEDVFICIAICVPQIKSCASAFLSFSLFLARCAHFVIALFGFPWNVGVDNFGSVEEATHNRAHKAREIICCARRGWNCNQLNQSNFICIGQVCKEKCPKRLHIIYKCRPLEPQSGWGKTSKILNRGKKKKPQTQEWSFFLGRADVQWVSRLSINHNSKTERSSPHNGRDHISKAMFESNAWAATNESACQLRSLQASRPGRTSKSDYTYKTAHLVFGLSVSPAQLCHLWLVAKTP